MQRDSKESRCICYIYRNMIPILLTFEQIQQEAKRLIDLKISDIRHLDEDYVVNLLCAFIAVAYKMTTAYAEKYNLTGFNGKLDLINSKRAGGRCSDQGRISLNPMVVFGNERCLRYIVLHELAHTKHHHHRVEFWEYLQQILYAEKIINEVKPFKLVTDSYGRLQLYWGDKQVTGNSWEQMKYQAKEGFKYIEFLPSSDYYGENGNIDKKLALISRVFVNEKLSEYRKAKNNTYLVDDENTPLSMRPIWDKYIDIYGIRSFFILTMDMWSLARSKDTRLNVREFKVFEPQTNL